MGWGSFYKSKKPRGFRYTYLTFDPKKKELERKIRLSKHRVDPEANPLTEEDLKENLKGHFRRNSERLAKYGDPEDFSREHRKENKAARLRTRYSLCLQLLDLRELRHHHLG